MYVSVYMCVRIITTPILMKKKKRLQCASLNEFVLTMPFVMPSFCCCCYNPTIQTTKKKIKSLEENNGISLTFVYMCLYSKKEKENEIEIQAAKEQNNKINSKSPHVYYIPFN